MAELPENHQVVVFDNGSSDNTEQVIKDYKGKPTLTYIKSEINLGFSGGCNGAFLEAKGEYICFLNNDTKVRSNKEGWTQPLIENAGDGLIGPTIGLLNRSLDFITEASVWPANRELLVYLSGWNITAKRVTWERFILPGEVGPFTTEFGKAYFEDPDLCFRAAEMGIPMKLLDVPVTHFGKVTSQKIGISSLYVPAKQKFVEKWKERSKKLPKQY